MQPRSRAHSPNPLFTSCSEPGRRASLPLSVAVCPMTRSCLIFRTLPSGLSLPLRPDDLSICTVHFPLQIRPVGSSSMKSRPSPNSSMRSNFSTMRRSAFCRMTGGRGSFSVAAQLGDCGDPARICCLVEASCIVCIRSQASNTNPLPLQGTPARRSLQREARYRRFRATGTCLRLFLTAVLKTG